MKIQYCSDLHLEFKANAQYINQNPLKISGDILILAGDIIPLHDEFFNHPFFQFVSENYRKVYWVPGNHEFYHRNLSDFGSSYQIPLLHNVSIVHNISVTEADIELIFSTLWSHIEPERAKIIENSVSDFSTISKNNKHLNVTDFNQLHQESLDYIRLALSQKAKKSIVVTHHLPSNLCNSKAHINSPINQAFCVDLSAFIETCGANFWIYGHSHFNQKPIQIGQTLLLTNQLGYVHHNEHKAFKNNAFVSI